MAGCKRSICLSLLLSLSLFAADDAAPALIEQLQHEDFEVRRTAAEKLEKLGEDARDALEAAQNGADPDTRRALNTLLKKLDVATVRLLAFDRDGNPAAGAEATVQLYNVENNDWNERRSLTATFDPGGKSLLEDRFNLRANMVINLTNWSATTPNMQLNLELERGENLIPLVAHRPGKATFTVLNPDGKPVKDVQVKLLGPQRFDPEFLELQLKLMETWGGFGGTRTLAGSTGDDGKVTIENIPEGVYTVVGRGEGHKPGMLGALRVRENDILVAPPLQVVPREAGKVSVKLIGLDGKPGKVNEVYCTLEPILDAALDPAKARRLRQMLLQMRWNNERPQPDEKGVVEFKDVPAGKYRVLTYFNNLPRTIDLIEVKSGAAIDAGTIRQAAAGGINGKIVDQNGKGLTGATITVFRRADMADELADSTLNLQVMRQTVSQYGTAYTNANGAYELKNLPEDDYVAVIQHGMRHAVIFDLKVPADKPISAPQVMLSMTEKQMGKEMKIRILLADGTPAAGASAMLTGPQVSSNGYSDEKGLFRYYNQAEPYTQMIIVANKHRPRQVDLTAPEFASGDSVITLERQQYGSVMVTVVDEAGQPVVGAIVEPAASQGRNYYYRYPRGTTRFRTDQFGRTRLSGLYAGDRKLVASKRGYVMKADALVTIKSNEEGELRIVLRDALELGGTVELPPDYNKGDVFANLTGPVNVIRKVSGGKFSFSRLPPGDYEVSLIAPGLQTLEKTKVTLKADQPPPLDLKVSAAKSGTLLAELPARYQGWKVAVSPPGEWNPEKYGEFEKRSYSWSAHSIDGQGRFEQVGVKPGSYDLYLIPATDQYRNYYVDQQFQVRTTYALQIVRDVPTRTTDSIAALRTVEAPKLEIEPATGAINGRIAVDNPKAITNAQLYVVLAGPTAYATMQWNVPSEFTRAQQPEPVLINAPPNLKLVANGISTNFRIENVPPGEYGLYGKLYSYNNAELNKASKPVKLATVTVKAQNETIELGEIKFTIPAVVLEKQKPPQKAFETEYSSDEGVSTFKP